VDAATVLLDDARRLGVGPSALYLHGEAGPPVLTVETEPAAGGELCAGVFGLLRERLGVIGSERIGRLVIPLLTARGWFATLVHGSGAALPIEIERELALRATELSVWCTERGIGRVPRVAGGGDLAPRRYRVAHLAAQGLTNAEIAQTLDISINTVKSRLKQVFVQLEVDNRTELSHVLRRLAPVREVPLGVTRLRSVTVTRITP